MNTQLSQEPTKNQISVSTDKLLELLNGGKPTLFHKKSYTEELPMKMETLTSDIFTKLEILTIKTFKSMLNTQVISTTVSSSLY